MKKFYLIAIIIGMNLSVNAQPDNLEPEVGYFNSHPVFDEYTILLKKILFENLPYAAEARVLVEPSFSEPQYLVSIDTKDGISFLTYRVVKEKIKITGNNSNKIGFREYKMKIDTSLANKLHELFFLATSKARYHEEPYFGTDGVTYNYMSFKQFYGSRSGKIWSPDNGRLAVLVQLTEWLTKCAKAKEIVDQEIMTSKIEKLIDSFKKN